MKNESSHGRSNNNLTIPVKEFSSHEKQTLPQLNHVPVRPFLDRKPCLIGFRTVALKNFSVEFSEVGAKSVVFSDTVYKYDVMCHAR